MICLSHQLSSATKSDMERLETQNIKFLGCIPEFSTFRFWHTIKGACLLRKLVKGYHINIVHVLYAEPNALWSIFKKWLRIPFFLTTRGTDVLITIPNFFKSKSVIGLIVSALYRYAFSNFDQVTSTSINQKRSVEQIAGKPMHIQVIRTGIDIHNDFQYELEPSFQKPFIFFPRLMKPVYYHEFTIDALALLPSDIKSRFQMVFIGKDGLDKRYIKFIHDKMKANPDLNFLFLETLNQDQVRAAYLNAHLTVMNPASDGSPVTALEAMFFECPLILPPLNYDPDLFENVDKFEKWEPQSLSDKIELLINNKPPTSSFKKTVELLGNRALEMEKLYELYVGLCENYEHVQA